MHFPSAPQKMISQIFKQVKYTKIINLSTAKAQIALTTVSHLLQWTYKKTPGRQTEAIFTCHEQ